MRSFRPSGKAVLAAGALAVTLAVAGTSGAIAGSLITSQDIKNGTIQTKDLKDDAVTNGKLAPGAVDWNRSLSAAAKEQIQSFVSEGVPGPQGPRGPRGSDGASGADGMGKIVFWDYFGLSQSEPDGTAYELPPMNGQRLLLDEPGDYLVTMRGVTQLSGPDDFGTAIVVGDPSSGGGIDSIFNACTAGGMLSVGIPIATCNTSFPISVQPGESLELPIYAERISTEGCDDGEGGTSCPPAFAAASVTVYQINATPTGEPYVPCGRSTRQLLKGTSASRC
jgi:hypothetical protein